ncbi:hypothetical protein BDZ85DRAFT_282290 [Elsinoe ampelina]|uniref:Uncharacterized protein n=1 Tax=Elsinoe ampelina TaxID=302913 RepID=A0A6A6GC19_9PEZI|nr:hypothetical protein BDZ85DRAFT_282290 [Elsinoe ampelina]
MFTEVGTDSVWYHGDPYGISTAYELVKRRTSVIMLEAREVLSGETDRTSGHLSSALDDWYTNIQSKHGHDGAATAYESHKFVFEHVGEIAKELKIDCEQIYDPHDYVAFIGLNQGKKRTWTATGDSGNGLTHGVLGARIIADGITGGINPWQDHTARNA